MLRQGGVEASDEKTRRGAPECSSSKSTHRAGTENARADVGQTNQQIDPDTR
jgi:hypothetical protein